MTGSGVLGADIDKDVTALRVTAERIATCPDLISDPVSAVEDMRATVAALAAIAEAWGLGTEITTAVLEGRAKTFRRAR